MNDENENGRATNLVGTAEAARILGVSEVTITRRARDLGGKRRGKAWAFDADWLRSKAQGGGNEVPRTRGASSPQDGSRAAAVFSMLDEGAQLGRVVTTLGEAPDFVKRMRAEWLECQRLDREGVSFQCSCGAPSNPNTARCDRCHARTMVVTDAQRSELAGQHLPDGFATCTACGQQHAIPDMDRLCAGCRSRIAVVVESGKARVVLKTARGPITLHVLALEEARAVAATVAPVATVQPVVPARELGIELPPEPPKQSITAEIHMMQSQLDEINDGMAKARADLEKES